MLLISYFTTQDPRLNKKSGINVKKVKEETMRNIQKRLEAAGATMGM